MAQYKVIVPLLNKRNLPVLNTADKGNITGQVVAGFKFESIEQKTNLLGNWFKDRDGSWYWGGGVEEVQEPVDLIPEKDSKDEENINIGWGLQKLLIPEFWKTAGNKGDNVTIAILDTGISSTHPEFDYTKIKRVNILTGDKIAEDIDGHGSHVAGIIAAQGKKITGAAPRVNLLVIKIAEKSDSWEIGNVVKGIQHAIEEKADIISISGEFPKRNPDLEILKQKIQEAIEQGIIIVASAGNNFRNVPVESFPAAFDECISVGSIKQDGVRADSSSHSTKLDIVAPGEEILSSWIGKDYRVESGTSMATPLVSGIAAVIVSFAKSKLNRSITPSEMQVMLNKSADDAGEGGFDTSYGFGIINPGNALKILTA